MAASHSRKNVYYVHSTLPKTDRNELDGDNKLDTLGLLDFIQQRRAEEVKRLQDPST
jgi:hypothetical protein